ncbi:unnamed protein product [Oikopleura dioica]|uniref:G-protein coupled receptors family 1 profile domain-containing protein n=1 Tax=Oikopleura dioica TaxID=34765 RepID=E4X506_OIKDI|nr:unnamed protein product [Oikopleura dioica]CBY33543.1 unnamed protein product [Oikopleura dioica]
MDAEVRKRQKSSEAVTRQTRFVTGAFFLSWLPRQIIHFLSILLYRYIHGDDQRQFNDIMKKIEFFSVLIAYSNVFLVPLAFFIAIRLTKRELKETKRHHAENRQQNGYPQNGRRVSILPPQDSSVSSSRISVWKLFLVKNIGTTERVDSTLERLIPSGQTKNF